MRPWPFPFARRMHVVALLGLLSVARGDTSNSLSWLEEYFSHWSERVETARNSQPLWISALGTTNPRLGQELRFDHHHQTFANGDTVDLEGGGKGLSFIPAACTQITLALPPYQHRRGSTDVSGFADWSGVSVKYRLLSATERHGNYVVSVIGQYGFPTGSGIFTNRNHVFTSTLAGGKGFGRFDAQVNFGAAVPLRDHSRSGRAFVSNLVFQYHAGEWLWPELELNRTDWSGGRRDGRSQTLFMPGLLVGRFPFGTRYKFSAGLGYQTHLSRVYAAAPATPTFNHNWILSSRVSF